MYNLLLPPPVRAVLPCLPPLPGAGAGSRKRAKGTAVKVKGRLSSAYTMFVTQMFGVLKAAGIANISLQDVSGLWQALPEELREDIVARFNAIK